MEKQKKSAKKPASLRNSLNKSSLRVAMTKAIKQWANQEGTLFPFAYRDALTDMMHIAEEYGLNFNEKLKGAREVFEEEKLD